MSWSFSYTSLSEDAAKAMIDDLAAHEGSHIPEPVVAIVKSMIDALPDEPNTVVLVSSFGHFGGNQFGGTSNMQIAVSQNYKSAVDDLNPQPKAEGATAETSNDDGEDNTSPQTAIAA